MKVSRHFIYVCSERKYSRTYGGSTYTLKVYEFKGKGKLEYVGSVTACTRGHRGEESEAWSVVANKFPKLAQKVIDAGAQQGYYSFRDGEAAGVKLQNLGGC